MAACIWPVEFRLHLAAVVFLFRTDSIQSILPTPIAGGAQFSYCVKTWKPTSHFLGKNTFSTWSGSAMRVTIPWLSANSSNNNTIDSCCWHHQQILFPIRNLFSLVFLRRRRSSHRLGSRSLSPGFLLDYFQSLLSMLLLLWQFFCELFVVFWGSGVG